ncbi:MAG: GNAT family N-acetyltransferase [Bacilli bacterium]|nr:GNAT family N-acetyltransferase [Bacilli bacterium]
MNEFALFEYPEFDNYFTCDNYQAFFVREKETNKLLGFLMINSFNSNHSIKEFMIIPKYRRRGIGKKVMNLCFQKYKGNYSVTPSFGSKMAYLFWGNVINLHTNNNYKFEDGIFYFIV